MQLDTLLKNATIVTDTGRFQGSIGVRDGKIAGEFAAGAEPQAETESEDDVVEGEIVDEGGAS